MRSFRHYRMIMQACGRIRARGFSDVQSRGIIRICARASYNGITPASQAGDEGSIPFARFPLQSSDPRVVDSLPVARVSRTHGVSRLVRTALALVLLCGCASAWGQTLSFAQGSVEAAPAGGSFRRVDPGDDLSGFAVLRLGEGAYAELQTSRGVLRFGAAGEYSLNDLRDASPPAAPAAGTAGRLLGQMQSRPDPRNITAAGARAVNPTAPPPVDWTGQEIIRAQLEQGLSLLEAGQPEAAIRPLRDVLDYAYLTPLEPYAGSVLALAQHRAGRTPDALQTLRDLQEFAEVDPLQEGVYALAAAEIYLETNNPSAVIDATVILTGDTALDAADFAAIGIPRYLALLSLGQTSEAQALRAQLLALSLPPDLAATVAGLPEAE